MLSAVHDTQGYSRRAYCLHESCVLEMRRYVAFKGL